MVGVLAGREQNDRAERCQNDIGFPERAIPLRGFETAFWTGSRLGAGLGRGLVAAHLECQGTDEL